MLYYNMDVKRRINILLLLTSIFIISFLIFYLYNNNYGSKGIYVKSDIDNRVYNVRDTQKKQELADTLAKINIRLQRLLDYINNMSDKTNQFNINIDLLNSRYKPETFAENIDLIDTSYTINKGEQVIMCLASRDYNEKIYDLNVLMFVAIHEFAHIGCITYEHNKEFHSFNNFLLTKANEIGVYKNIDFKKEPINYCGYIIDKN